MANYKLPEEVISVLKNARCDGDKLYLPPDQLDRKLYESVNKALSNAGGKWNRKARAHIFPTDAGPKLAEMLGNGVAVDEKKRDQAFFSPPDVAMAAVRLADVRNQSVLEPQAGNGAIVAACKIAGAAHITAIELNPFHLGTLSQQADVVLIVDFLQCLPVNSPYPLPITQFDRVVMNPPFTRNQDIQHVTHALKFLRLGGVLVSVMLDNQSRSGFRKLVQQYNPRIVELPRGAFKESGTDVPTILVRIER